MNEIEKRKANQTVIEGYLSGTLKEGEDISEYFLEDGMHVVPFSPIGEPVVIQGRAALKKMYDENGILFSDWKYTKIDYYPTSDPDIFWVEADGEGMSLFEGTPKPYNNHYFFFFKLRDGKIEVFKEIMDSLKLVREMGVEIPTDIASPHDQKTLDRVASFTRE